MSKLNGGYVMLDLNDNDNIYAKAKALIGCGKPILVYDDPICYYADSISLNGDGDVVIIKGGKTINITDANSVISEGIVTNPTLETIKDLAGNLRFVEGNISISDTMPEGFDVSYAKWSLSGTHLMLVVAGNVADGVTTPQGSNKFFAYLPKYILDKVIPTADATIEVKTIPLYASNLSSQTFNMYLNKITDAIAISMSGITLTADRSFRAQFDLLIDAE